MSNSQQTQNQQQASTTTLPEDDGTNFLTKIRTYLDDHSATGDQKETPTTKSTSSDDSGAPVKGMTNILDALLAKGKLTLDQFNTIKFESVNTNNSVDSLLVSHNIVTSNEIVKTYAEMRGVSYVSLRDIDIPLETLNSLPAALAKSSLAIVLNFFRRK